MQSNSPLGRPGAPGGTSGHRPDKKSWNIDNLGVILVPKMAFLGSGTDAISSKFGSDALKIKQFSIRTLAKFEFERDVFFFSGSAAEGAALGNIPFGAYSRPRGTRVVAWGSTRGHVFEARR